MTPYFVTACLVFTLLPFLVLSGATLRRYLAADIATYVIAALLVRQLGTFDLFVAAVALFVAKLGLFTIAIATGAHVHWSANRAAIIALSVYSLLIPAMQRSPIDGDEPYYLLMTESLVQDRDLDLANQYGALPRSATGRTDLVPQLGDRVGPRGEQYSHHEPFLPLLLVPGYAIGGLSGALATIVLFGALLVRSTVRWLEDEGIDERAVRAIVPLMAFGPPVVFYAARIWPEVPAAWLFVEAIRAMRHRRVGKSLVALAALSALKVRFGLVAVSLFVLGLRRQEWRRPTFIATIIVAVLAGILFGPLSSDPRDYVQGLFGLVLDGAAGIAFQAPLYLLAIFALLRWRDTPEGFRLGVAAALLYLIYLVPRSEWHGGWSPPLRYIVFLMPVLVLGAASVWDRVSAPAIAIIGLWTAGVVIHGLSYPWRLFHIANGENVLGEALSVTLASDFSRLFPSFIRVNDAAYIASVLFSVLSVVVFHHRGHREHREETICIIAVPVLSLALALFFVAGRKPGRVVHFEDAHVIKSGGELYPHMYQVARFNYRGGWMLHGTNSVSFLARGGDATLHYAARAPVLIALGARTYELPPTGDQYGTAPVVIDRTGRIELRVVRGSVNLDRIE